MEIHKNSLKPYKYLFIKIKTEKKYPGTYKKHCCRGEPYRFGGWDPSQTKKLTTLDNSIVIGSYLINFDIM